MPRFLWIGLLACVGVLAALLVLLRPERAPTHGVDAGSAAHAELVAPDDAELAAPARIAADRAAVEAPTAAPAKESDRVVPGRFQPEKLPSDGVVEVRVVRDEDGAPMPDVDVTISLGTGTETRPTDALGVVVFSGVRRPSANVTAKAPGRGSMPAVAALHDSPRASVEVRMYAERELAVRMLDPNGEALRPADWGIDPKSAQRLGLVVTKRCGSTGGAVDFGDAVIHSTHSGGFGPYSWRVRIRGNGDACINAVLGDVTIGIAVVPAGSTAVDVRTDASAIEAGLAPVVLRVLDAATDAPIAAATLQFQKSGLIAEPLHPTGPDGRVRLPMAAANRTTAIVRARGYAAVRQTIERPGRDEMVIRLNPGRRIVGRVVDQENRPLAGAGLWVRGQNLVEPTRTAADGTFEFVDVPAAELHLDVKYGPKSTRQQSYYGFAPANCAEGDVIGIEVRIDLTVSYDVADEEGDM